MTIAGTNLTGATAVTIGGTAATGMTVVNATTITATSPAHAAGAADVVVTTPGGTGTGTGLFTYAVVAPTITAISPSSGPTAGGTAVTITGTNLTGATAVTIGGTAATGVTVVNATTITATTPAGTDGAANVVVTTPGGTGTGLFTYSTRPDPSKDAEVIALLNAQVQMAKRFGQTQIGNYQTHLESLHARSQALLQDGNTLSSRGAARTPAETTATSLTEFSNGTNTGTGNNTAALFSPRSSNVATDTLCQTRNTGNCLSSGGIRPVGDGMDSLVPGTLTSANTRTDWWPWPTLSMNGSSKDLLGSGMDVWSAGTVNVGRQSENDSRFTTSGISVGGDDRITDTLILGVGAGFGHERQKIGSNDTKNQGDSYSVVVYGSYQPQDGFFIDGLVGYGHLSFDADRYVTSTGDIAQSSRNGTQWFSSLSGGYEYVDGKFLLSPYGRFDMVHTRLNQSTESGAGIYNLTYLDQTSRSSKLSFGLRGETTFEIDNGTVKPSLRFEYQHEFAEPGVADMMYADDLNGRVYALDMENADHNTMVLGLGLDFALRKSWQTGLSYKFSHSSSSSSQMQSFGVFLKRGF